MKIQAPTYVPALQVLEILRKGNSSTVVIDVREDDRVGGHIKGSHNVPAPAFRSNPENYLHLADGKNQVFFHCMFSQVRGPACAKAFVQAWNRASSNANSPAPRVSIMMGGFHAVARLALEGNDVADIVEDFNPELFL